MRRIGLYSGSFNPIHHGHVMLANYLVEFSDLDELWFVVSPQNPLKRKADLMDDADRLKMVELALEGNPRMKASDDYGFLGKPKDDVVTDLQAEHYDLMIDLTTRPLLALRYLALYADADFKVGMNLGEGLHDMLIALPDFDPEQGDEAGIEASWLYNEIMKYLTTIKSND